MELSPGKIQMEIQEFVNGVGGMPVTLYDGAIANLPGCLHGGCGQQHQPDWNHARIESDQSWLGLGGEYSAQRRRIYTAGWHTAEAAECHLERTGKVVFYTGYAPAAGEQIAVSYRTVGRAVGRAVNTASQQALAQAGSPAWLHGSVR